MAGREQRVEVRLIEGARMVAKMGDHEVTFDLSEKLGGTDSAPSPTEMFMASIAACKLFYAYRFLSRREVATNGGTSTITWQSNKKHIETAQVKLEMPEGVDPKLVDDCLKMVRACFVTASVEADMKIEATLE
ncbi:MAG: OsmC family protein [Deltaproteobacteria bacterium]|nr:OsmC family protein [Deltaproteobacteria bacterium]